jgi:hypothetical protein
MNASRCGTCVFWASDAREPLYGHVNAECRRHAPTVVDSMNGFYSRREWPTTINREWCGDHKPVTETR